MADDLEAARARRQHNQTMVDRVKGAPAQPATPESDAEAHKEQDEIVLALVKQGFRAIPIAGGNEVILVDNFEDRNVCWKAAPVRRYDLKVRRLR